MGGRKSYSVKKVTGKGLGKHTKSIQKALETENPLDIALTTTQAAIDNKKFKDDFSKTLKILLDLSKTEDKEKVKETKDYKEYISDYDLDSKPLTKEEKKYLSYALKRSRRRKK